MIDRSIVPTVFGRGRFSHWPVLPESAIQADWMTFQLAECRQQKWQQQQAVRQFSFGQVLVRQQELAGAWGDNLSSPNRPAFRLKKSNRQQGGATAGRVLDALMRRSGVSMSIFVCIHTNGVDGWKNPSSKHHWPMTGDCVPRSARRWLLLPLLVDSMASSSELQGIIMQGR